MTGKILIVDDDEAFAKTLARNLKRRGHDTAFSLSAKSFHEVMKQNTPDVVVLDYQLPDADGLTLLDELHKTYSACVFLMATAYPDLEVAVQAIKRGAFDYVAKDAEPRECILRIERCLEVAVLRRQVAEANRPANQKSYESTLIGDHASMKKLRKRLKALEGASDTTVLITGETGTGKGHLARVVHEQSSRKYEPFVAVDCTTIAPTLVESELFGHEKGSFSGATQSQMGKVEAAGSGTLFLDEIGELDLPVQSKLLRLLEEKEYTRVGSTKVRKVKARIITATNRNLEKAVMEGRFREDLRYRLEVFVLEVPALRKRGEDIGLLTKHFLDVLSRSLGRKVPEVHQEVLKVIPQYTFPGNVRELRNMVEQAILLEEGGTLTLDGFPVLGRVASGWRPSKSPSEFPTISQIPNPATNHNEIDSILSFPKPHEKWSEIPEERNIPNLSLTEIREITTEREKQAVMDALRATGGNITAAARCLGFSRNQMNRRIQKYGLK